MNNNRFQSNIIVIIYLLIILITTTFVFYRYPQNEYFWTLIVASIIWILAGLLSIWYAWKSYKQYLSIFFFISFILLYWTAIYFTLERNSIVIVNLSKS